MNECTILTSEPRKLASFRNQLRPQTFGVHRPWPNTYQYVPIRALRKNCDLLGTEESEALHNAPALPSKSALPKK